ncbi:hypothetical protein DID78_04040 [Candidatus Marinamargulisbacteria bacterium SCGC AG-343-D04]|nr:hypothetical protein DID78_04040 [Candidatus Marinamargulisbacteria bacterium SCGC AG-343-D04]
MALRRSSRTTNTSAVSQKQTGASTREARKSEQTKFARGVGPGSPEIQVVAGHAEAARVSADTTSVIDDSEAIAVMDKNFQTFLATNNIGEDVSVDQMFEHIKAERGFDGDTQVKMQGLVDSGKYSKEEIVYAYKTKAQFNEFLSDADFITYLERGAELMYTEGATFEKGAGEGERCDIPAFMWFCQAKQGPEQINKGAMRLTFDQQGKAQKFFKQFEIAEAKPRWSSHFSQTGINSHGNAKNILGTFNKGLGLDIPKGRDDLRKDTPFGLGSILMNQTIQSKEDADKAKEAQQYLKKNSSKLNKMKCKHLTPQDLRALEANKTLNATSSEYDIMKALGMDFGVGVKFEDVGTGDRKDFTGAHNSFFRKRWKKNRLKQWKQVGRKSKEFKAAITKQKASMSKKDRKRYKKGKLGTKHKEHLSSLGKKQQSAILKLAEQIQGFETYEAPRIPKGVGALLRHGMDSIKEIKFRGEGEVLAGVADLLKAVSAKVDALSEGESFSAGTLKEKLEGLNVKKVKLSKGDKAIVEQALLLVDSGLFERTEGSQFEGNEVIIQVQQPVPVDEGYGASEASSRASSRASSPASSRAPSPTGKAGAEAGAEAGAVLSGRAKFNPKPAVVVKAKQFGQAGEAVGDPPASRIQKLEAKYPGISKFSDYFKGNEPRVMEELPAKKLAQRENRPVFFLDGKGEDQELCLSIPARGNARTYVLKDDFSQGASYSGNVGPLDISGYFSKL